VSESLDAATTETLEREVFQKYVPVVDCRLPISRRCESNNRRLEIWNPAILGTSTKSAFLSGFSVYPAFLCLPQKVLYGGDDGELPAAALKG